MKPGWRDAIFWLVWLLVVAGVGVGGWWWRASTRKSTRPVGIMGTDCYLVAEAPDPDECLKAAEAELRRIEALLSTHIEKSDMSRLNKAAGQAKVPLHPDTLQVIRCARKAFTRTDGAFDATCRPLVELWQQARDQNRIPSSDEIESVKSQWSWFPHEGGAIIKCAEWIQLDLGGVAKGWAVDQAINMMRELGATAGMVEVGGDLRVFGPGDREDGSWTVRLAAPTGEKDAYCAALAIKDRAVCTSGNYHRHFEIEGKRYSHIIDPRTGYPADVAASVTVVAPDATTADIWATALSVLGATGLELLPENVDALLIRGVEPDSSVIRSANFARWEVAPVDLPKLGVVD